MTQSITISDQEIYIEAQYFVHKDYSITGKEMILDIMSMYYTGQLIRIKLFDGENIKFSGFISFVEDLCEMFNINPNTVLWETHDYQFDTKFTHQQMSLGIFISTNRYIPYFNQTLVDPQFVGMSLGRFNPVRLRLAYEIDRAFPGDNFTIFQPEITEITDIYQHIKSLGDIYHNELDWLKNKSFNQDLQSEYPSGTVDWQTSLQSYPNIWGRYQIEIVSETDAMSDFWFTEKTARCLATGKPFALVAGTGSLQRLRYMGFKTFNSVLDESYDLETTPTRRINRLILSLKELYNSQAGIEKLQEIAQENINIYKDYIKNF